MEVGKKVIIATTKEGVVVEKENVSPIEQLVMCLAMVRDTANELEWDFNKVLSELQEGHEMVEKDREIGILS